nr:hypothetical protein [uncultured Shinella sp.]
MSRGEQFIDLLHEARIMGLRAAFLVRALLLEIDTSALNERRCLLNVVQLFQDHGKWVVVVIEGDKETRDTFDFEDHASNWADGQRIRLKLPRLKHMTTNGG